MGLIEVQGCVLSWSQASFNPPPPHLPFPSPPTPPPSPITPPPPPPPIHRETERKTDFFQKHYVWPLLSRLVLRFSSTLQTHHKAHVDSVNFHTPHSVQSFATGRVKIFQDSPETQDILGGEPAIFAERSAST